MEQLVSALLRAGLYGRASSDPKMRGRSVADQMTDNRRLSAERNWVVVDEYIDLNRSASRHATKAREQYERLIADIEAGKLDVVVAWEASRLQRDTNAYMRLRDACEKAGVIWCCNGTIQDMRNGSDRVTSIIMAAIAEKEADDIQARNARTTRLAAERGNPHGRIPFGYLRRYDPLDGHLLGQFPHPTHAEVVVDIFKRASACEPLRSLVPIIRQHVPNSTVAGVRYLLTNRAYIGLRSRRGEYTTAMWDGIVDEGLFWRVQELLCEPGRRTQTGTRAVHLLSGIAGCGVCEPGAAGQTLKGVPPGYHTDLRYSCRGFGHVSVGAERLDAFVEEALLDWLRKPEAAAAFLPPSDGAIEKERSRLVALRTQLKEGRELASQFDPATYVPRLSAASLADMETRLLPAIEACEEQVRKLSAIGDPIVDRLLGADPELVQSVWDALVIEQQRHALRRLVRITLMPAERPGDPELNRRRVHLVFASEEGFQVQTRWTPRLRRVAD